MCCGATINFSDKALFPVLTIDRFNLLLCYRAQSSCRSFLHIYVILTETLTKIFLQNTGDNGAMKPALLMLGNKADKEAERVVATRSARQLAEDYRVHFAEVSALTGVGVEKVSLTIGNLHAQ